MHLTHLRKRFALKPPVAKTAEPPPPPRPGSSRRASCADPSTGRPPRGRDDAGDELDHVPYRSLRMGYQAQVQPPGTNHQNKPNSEIHGKEAGGELRNPPVSLPAVARYSAGPSCSG